MLGRRGPETELTRLVIWGWQFGAGIAGGLVFIAVFLVAARLLRISEFFGLLNRHIFAVINADQLCSFSSKTQCFCCNF